MLIDDASLNDAFEKEYQKLRNEVRKPGILLAGAAGVGKSSLVNMIFGEETAVVGTGTPVTQKIDCFDNGNSSVRIYDSRGYEMNDSGDQEFFNDVIGMVKNPAQHNVNIIWYCISALGGRVTDYDKKAITQFANAGCPVAAVLTKSDRVSDEEVKTLKDIISEIPNIPIFETSILLPEVNQIDKLVEWSIAKLPQHLQFAFIAQQRCSFEEKRKSVKNVIAQHVVGAGITGFAPIPFSDAPILAANEIALMTRILYLYDLGGIGNSIKGLGFEGLLTLVGKTAVASLLKFIPGIGTVIGGAITGSVAVAITWAFGAAVALACEQVWKAKLDGNEAAAEAMLKNLGGMIMDIAKQNIENKKTSEDSVFN